MPQKTAKLGALDRCHAGGIMLVLSGAAVIAATLLVPAHLDVRDLQAQRAALTTQMAMLDTQTQAHRELQNAAMAHDPQALRRLGWRYLNIRPVGAQAVGQTGTAGSGYELWINPASNLPEQPRIPGPLPRSTQAKSLLVRYTTGPARPWVLAFGAWLILAGLILNPTPRTE